MAGFAVLWDSFLFFWYSQALGRDETPWIAVVFPLGHVAAGIGITYYVIAASVNTTDVTISESLVEVASGPVPWLGDRSITVDQFTAVLVRERRGSRGARTYSVMYADRQRKERTLLKGLPRLDQAEFIADTIRDTLALDAKPVA